MTEESGNNLNELDTLLDGLTPTQRAWVGKRILVTKDIEACRDAKVSQQTIWQWRKDGAPLDRVILLIQKDMILYGRSRLRQMTPKALTVLEMALDGKKKFEAAIEVLDRVGLPEQRQVEVTGPKKGPLRVEYVNNWRPSITDAASGSDDGSGVAGEIPMADGGQKVA